MLVLQERRTLDDVLKTGVCTYRNGCNYRLVKELDGNYYLEYGCDGVLINLIYGDEKLLYRWFVENKSEEGLVLLSGIVENETIEYLLEKRPCSICGGARFRIKASM